MSNSDSIVHQKRLLTISIVTFHPDFNELQNTLDSLVAALGKLDPDAFSITIVDNSKHDSVSFFLKKKYAKLHCRLVHGHGNIGFGRGHNLVLQEMGEFHLILNPDIKLQPDTILNAIAFMDANPSCGLITPYAQWPTGERQYLCKRYPAAFDLMLRGFAPKSIRSFFKKRLDHYEMQYETQNNVYWNPPIVSGCFMFFRSAILRKIGGFDSAYFLYFEDFDLSLKVHKLADIAYVPTVRIIHGGGHAAKKGLWHIQTFSQSAMHFYKIHGFSVF